MPSVMPFRCMHESGRESLRRALTCRPTNHAAKANAANVCAAAAMLALVLVLMPVPAVSGLLWGRRSPPGSDGTR